MRSSCRLELLINACRREVWAFLKHFSLGSWWSDCNFARYRSACRPHDRRSTWLKASFQVDVAWRLTSYDSTRTRPNKLGCDPHDVTGRSNGRFIKIWLPKRDRRMLINEERLINAVWSAQSGHGAPEPPWFTWLIYHQPHLDSRHDSASDTSSTTLKKDVIKHECKYPANALICSFKAIQSCMRQRCRLDVILMMLLTIGTVI